MLPPASLYDGLTLISISSKQPIKTQASQAKNTWCKRQFVYIENCMGKSPIMKKEEEVAVSNNFTKRRRDDFKIGTRDK